MGVRRSALVQKWGVVIAAGLIMGAALGIRHTQGLFMQPVLSDQNWTREAFGFVIAIQNLAWGLTQPITGILADRYGSGKVIFSGLMVYACGLLLMADASSLSQFTLSNGLLIGLALSGSAFGTVYGALSRLFADSERGWALAVAGALGGLGQFSMVPAVQGLLDSFHWSSVCVFLGISMLLMSPLAILLKESGRHNGKVVKKETTSKALAIAFRHRGFWLLNAGFFACGFQLAFIATHLPSYLTDNGLSVHQGATALACIALANTFGMYYAGRSIGVFRTKYVLAHVYLTRAIAMVIFISFPVTAASTYAFSALMGFLWLGTAPLSNNIVVRLFGVNHVATLFGFVFFGHQLGSFLGVWLGGYVYDTYHSYDLIWLIAIVAGLASAISHFCIDDRPYSHGVVLVK